MTRDFRKDRAINALLTTDQRFWTKVDGSGDLSSCWVWIGSIKPTGYGVFAADKGRFANAHKWAYEQLVGEVPPGLHLDHLCRNRACVNPWHLEPVTPLVNTRRGVGNHVKTHCPQGHPYSPDNTYVHDGRRSCHVCRKRAMSAYRERQRSAA